MNVALWTARRMLNFEGKMHETVPMYHSRGGGLVYFNAPFIRGRDHLATKIGSNLEITARGASKRDPLYGDKSCEEVRNSRDVLETGILIKTPTIQSKNRIRPHTFQ